VHAFDGWWLSLRREDSFLQRLRPLADAAHHLHDAVRFNPRNPRTLGFTVFDQVELDASQRWQLEAGGPPKRPDTTLARGRHTREEHMARRSRMSEALERALERLLDAMAEVEADGDGRVSRSECAALLESGTLSERDARLLFGTDDPAHIFEALDHNGDDHISFDELIRFADARNISLTAHSGLAGREPTTVTNFMSTVFATALQHIRRLSLHPEDRFRTVPINTDYIGTADFELEPGDREFLLQTGRRATEAFLADAAARHAR
jgi:arachidonate 5-lipoxygenase